MENHRHPLEILLVEDDEGDALLAHLAFEESSRDVNLHHVENGINCIKYLRRETPYEDAEQPDLIFLDINMPLMGGFEVLAELKEDVDLCEIPTIVLTTSGNPDDVVRALELRAKRFITKPTSIDEFFSVLDAAIAEY